MTNIKQTYSYLVHYLHVLGLHHSTRPFRTDKELSLPSIFVSILYDPGTGSFVHGFGVSSQSADLARLKSLSEAMERISLLQVSTKTTITTKSLIDKQVYPIPRTSVFYSAHSQNLPINPGVGVGFGTDSDEVLLRGIYELVEKDACLTAYLLKQPLPKVEIAHLLGNRPKLAALAHGFARHGIEIVVLDATHDLQIPVFMVVLVDRSGKGPAISIGSKAGFDTSETILNSIEEAMMVYGTMKEKSRHHAPIPQEAIPHTPYARSLLWTPRSAIRQLSFWLESETIPKLPVRESKRKDELALVLHLLHDRGFDPRSAEISPPFVKKIGHHVHKLFIPGLQDYYFDENRRKISLKRIAQVAVFWKTKKGQTTNVYPHPFV